MKAENKDKKPSGTAENGLSFEEALAQLETTVQALESGNLSLEDSLRLFEEGINLTRRCTGLLSEAEKKMEVLLASGDSEVVLRQSDLAEAGNG